MAEFDCGEGVKMQVSVDNDDPGVLFIELPNGDVVSVFQDEDGATNTSITPNGEEGQSVDVAAWVDVEGKTHVQITPDENSDEVPTMIADYILDGEEDAIEGCELAIMSRLEDGSVAEIGSVSSMEIVL